MEKKDHVRINKTILGPLERLALNWLAEHLPAWVTPDHLTGLGLFASFLLFLSYCATNISINFLWLASFGFFLNWFGDSLDGTLARKRKIERPLYGFFIDHIIDAISTFLIFLGFGFSPYLNMELALIALIGYLLLSIYTYLSTYINNVFQISFGGLGPTERYKLTNEDAQNLLRQMTKRGMPITKISRKKTWAMHDITICA